MNYHERIKNHTIVAGGLDFCNVNLDTDSPIQIDTSVCIDHKIKAKYIYIISKNKHNNVIRDIGKKVNMNMAFTRRLPVEFDEYVDNEIHQKLAESLDRTGVIDMWIKQQNNNVIVLPHELKPIEEIVKRIYDFEKLINKDILNWNMWLLVDCRPISKGCTQRNAGFHYDGLNLSGKYAGTNLVSVYSWTNKLPSLFYTGKLKRVDDLDNYIDMDSINMSTYAQMKIDKRFIIKSTPNCLIKFDGATLHTGDVTTDNITDRVFIRVCFTPQNVWFDRIGNTLNPYLVYPESFKWRIVNDPSTRLINPVFYKDEQEFKNVWDVACLGHHAFCTMYEGKRAYEYQLIQSLRSTKGLIFIRAIKRLYDQDKTEFGKQRYRILYEKFCL